MTQQIRLDNDADHESNAIYVIKGDMGIKINFDADISEHGTRGECWNGQVVVDGSSWVEVDSTNNLMVDHVYDPADGYETEGSYAITDADRPRIIELIKQVITNTVTARPAAYDYYAA